MVKNYLQCIALALANVINFVTPTLATPFFFPSLNNSPAQESITTQDGTTCTQNVNSRTNLNVGVYGDTGSDSSNSFSFSQDSSNVGGFVILNVPLNSSQHLNCAKLLEIELERSRLRLEQERLNFQEPRPQESSNPMYKKTVGK